MKETLNGAGTEKANIGQETENDTTASTAPWKEWEMKNGKRPEAPAPPPEWTRYIDSRLKQFCTR